MPLSVLDRSRQRAKGIGDTNFPRAAITVEMMVEMTAADENVLAVLLLLTARGLSNDEQGRMCITLGPLE